MKKKQLKKSNIILLCLACAFMALALFFVCSAGKIGIVGAYTNGDPEIVTKSFLNSIISADYDKAVFYLSDCTKLSLENPNEGDAAKLFDALLDSYSYKIESVKKSKINAYVTVDFAGLNLPNIEKNVKNDVESITQKLSEEYPYEFVYDESRNYTQAFVEKVLETMLEKVSEAEEYRFREKMTLELVYTDGEWMIKQTPELVRVLSGNTIQDKQTSSVLNLSGSIGKFVDDNAFKRKLLLCGHCRRMRHCRGNYKTYIQKKQL